LPRAARAGGLRETRARLDALAGDDPYSDVRAVLSWSYRCLTSGAARLFRLLGLHPGPDITAAATASLAGPAPRRAPPPPARPPARAPPPPPRPPPPPPPPPPAWPASRRGRSGPGWLN